MLNIGVHVFNVKMKIGHVLLYELLPIYKLFEKNGQEKDHGMIRQAHKCDLMSAHIPGYHWNASRRCDGIAVVKAILDSGQEQLLCLAHGRQVRWHGLEGQTPRLTTIEPFPTLEDAMAVILGKAERFISTNCREGDHDACKVDFGQRVCICECEHPFAGDDFQEEVDVACVICIDGKATRKWGGGPVCNGCADELDTAGEML